MNQEEYYNKQGQQEAYENMNKVISGAIKRNGGATTALQIISVFNEFTAHLHYSKSLLNDELRDWSERETCEECPCEEPEDLFATEMTEIEALLNHLGYTAISVKGGN